MSSNHLVLCRPLLLLSSIFPSIRVFSSELAFLIRWPKYWRFDFSISQVKSLSCVGLFVTLRTVCSLPGSSVHGIFQARGLEWIAISFSRGSSRPRDRSWVSSITDRPFTVWATRETHFSISSSSEYSGLISFRLDLDWLDLLIVQGTLKSLLQHHSSKAAILQHSALFMVLL